MAKPTSTKTTTAAVTTATTAPVAAPAPAAGKKGGNKAAPAATAAPARRSGKPTVWRRLAGAIERAESSRKKVVAVLDAALARQHANYSTVILDRLKMASANVHTTPAASWDAVVQHLQFLDAERVPALKPPPAPKFKIGDAVRIVKKAVPHYTKAGLYTAAFLGELVVDRVSPDGRQFICRDTEGAESIHVRYSKHLEAR